MRTIIASLLVALCVASSALAAEQTVLGSRMKVSDPNPGVNPKKRKVQVIAKEKGTNVTVVGDPLADGATLEVIVNGATSTSQVLALPPGAPTKKNVGPGWLTKVVPGERAVLKYVDKNGTASPVIGLLFRWKAAGRMIIRVKLDAQRNSLIDVVPGNPTSELGIRLTLGTGDTYCVLFGGSAGGFIHDRGAKLVKARKPILEGCPVAAP